MVSIMKEKIFEKCTKFLSQIVDSFEKVAEGPLQSFYLLATGGNDDLVKLWHVRCGVHCTITLSHKLVGHNGNVNCWKFSMDGTLLASA